jgi:endonuclease YncB( thermonuclease family)
VLARLFVVMLLFITAAAADAATCPRGTLTGPVPFVRNGDTIEVGGMAIRLNGLAAPEGDEPGGEAALGPCSS